MIAGALTLAVEHRRGRPAPCRCDGSLSRLRYRSIELPEITRSSAVVQRRQMRGDLLRDSLGQVVLLAAGDRFRKGRMATEFLAGGRGRRFCARTSSRSPPAAASRVTPRRRRAGASRTSSAAILWTDAPARFHVQPQRLLQQPLQRAGTPGRARDSSLLAVSTACRNSDDRSGRRSRSSVRVSARRDGRVDSSRDVPGPGTRR